MLDGAPNNIAMMLQHGGLHQLRKKTVTFSLI